MEKLKATCEKCQIATMERLMPKSGICGNDGQDRINCWQTCWGECQALFICPKCICRCQKCRGTYCKECLKDHPYVAKFVEATCSGCRQLLKLETTPNVCGFEFDDDRRDYWIIYENDLFVCQTCYDDKTQ